MNHRHSRTSSRGQIMVLFAVAIMVLIGVVALAVDVGFLLAERRQNQAAVDAAAMSAAQSILDNKTSAEVQTAGKIYGAPNAGVLQGDVIVEWPVPGSGPRTGDKFVRVTITKDVQKFFLGAIYGGDWQVTTSAIAAIEDVQKPYALVALKCPGIELNGGIEIHIDGAGSAMSNCNITNSGASSLMAVGGSIDATGTIESNSSWTAPDGINPGVNPAPDPLAGATPPPAGAVRDVPTCLDDPICVIEPGHYTDKSFTVKNTVCMKSGTYYLDGYTKISFQNTNSLLTNKSPSPCPAPGGGVLIYIAPGSTASIDLGNGKIDLSTSYPIQPGDSECDPAYAPYTNAPCGMVLWIANGTPFTSAGNAEAKFEGVIYAPDSKVTLQGTPGSDGLQVIVGHLVLGGNAAFTINYREYVKLPNPTVFLVQ